MPSKKKPKSPHLIRNPRPRYSVERMLPVSESTEERFEVVAKDLHLRDAKRLAERLNWPPLAAKEPHRVVQQPREKGRPRTYAESRRSRTRWSVVSKEKTAGWGNKKKTNILAANLSLRDARRQHASWSAFGFKCKIVPRLPPSRPELTKAERSKHPSPVKHWALIDMHARNAKGDLHPKYLREGLSKKEARHLQMSYYRLGMKGVELAPDEPGY